MIRPLLLLVALSLVAADPASDAVKKERDKLLGMWVIVTIPGRVVNFERGLPLLTISSDKLISSRVVIENGKLVYKDETEFGTYTIDPTASPKTIDLKLAGGKAKGKIAHGIYRMDGDDLTICLGDPDGARPTKFVQTESGLVMICKRSTPESQKKVIADLEALTLQARVALPVSPAAKPFDPKAADTLTLDIDNEGRISVFGQSGALGSSDDVRRYLRDEFAARKKQAGAEPVKTTVVLRADKISDFMPAYMAAEAAHVQGFPRIVLKVVRTPGEFGELELILPDWRRPESFPEVTVLVRTIRDGINDGNISAIIITSEKGETAIPDRDALKRHLKPLADSGAASEKKSIRISPECKLKVEAVVDVMDAALTSGFASVIMDTPPDLVGVGGMPNRLPSLSGTNRLAPPDAAAQAKAAKEIKAIYEKQFAGAQPADLARRLRQAADICDDPAARFVLLRESADAAGRAGKIPASMEALDRLASHYGADVWAMKLERFKNAPGTREVADAALKQAGAASLANRKDIGIRFWKLAHDAARQTKDADLLAFVEERRVLFELPRPDGIDPFAPLPAPTTPAERPATKKAEAKPPADHGTTGDDSSGSSQGTILWYIASPGIGLLLLGVILAWWLRKGDAAVRTRIAEARQGQFQMPGDESAGNPPQAPQQGA